MSDLKPCPFCGEEVRIDEFYDPFITIDCDNCISSISLHSHTQEDGISAWNKRDEGWVSVDDRMPELILGKVYSEMVMVFSGDYIYIAFCSNNPTEWTSGLDSIEYEIRDVTHWKPLPPKPE